MAERASPDRAAEFELARQRLVGKNEGEMGGFFKVMAIADRAVAPPPGFEPVRRDPDERSRTHDRAVAPTARARHAFFTRSGGYRKGLRLAERRRRVGRCSGGGGREPRPDGRGVGLAPEPSAIPYQIHSPELSRSRRWAADARPRCDALVTATPGLALGVTGADCGMILFADAEARVIGAAHAGWKGARQLMYTRYRGWFFDEISGIETEQVIAYAARVLQLARKLFGESAATLEAEFVRQLGTAPSNIPAQKNGANVYEHSVKSMAVGLEQVGAHYAISSVFTSYPEQADLFCYTIRRQAYGGNLGARAAGDRQGAHLLEDYRRAGDGDFCGDALRRPEYYGGGEEL